MYFLPVHINVFDHVHKYSTSVFHGVQGEKNGPLLTGFKLSSSIKFRRNLFSDVEHERNESTLFG